MISTQVLKIKDRDKRVGRIQAKVSSAAELKKVEAIKARDGRVGRVEMRSASAEEASCAVAVEGDHRVTVMTANVSEALEADAMPEVARSVVRSIRRDVIEAAEAAGLDVYALDAATILASGKARRAAYRKVLRDASVRGIPDRRSAFAKKQACWRQIRRLRRVLRSFFDDRAADEARKPWVCEVGVGAVDRVVPLPDKLLPLHDETTAWLNRIESVLRLRTGARFSKKMLERLITEEAMFIHRGAADGEFPCRNHPTTRAPSESSKTTRPYSFSVPRR